METGLGLRLRLGLLSEASLNLAPPVPCQARRVGALLLKHLAQNIEHMITDRWRELSEFFDESFLVYRPQLIEYDLPFNALNGRWESMLLSCPYCIHIVVTCQCAMITALSECSLRRPCIHE